jgi:hypothetical protein
LDQAITLDREALALRPVGHPDWSSSLSSLANRLSTRFDQQGNDEDLDQAIAFHGEVLALHPVGHTDRFSSLSNLAVHLSTYFVHRGNRDDLNKSLENPHHALTLLTRHDPRQEILQNLFATICLSLHLPCIIPRQQQMLSLQVCCLTCEKV